MNAAYRVTVFALRLAVIAGIVYGVYSAVTFAQSVALAAGA